ncbi:hypothetical protein ZHAS_00014561 [Anopheles sinensis]|uniref:Uncharacterized protein n=1 Tax=Anopheles sinensis TaxID=74873 RepID=A0A084W8W0_ANOSI|nr:hypothetical protein ZHAS_00014561 [Anopheles sinensis]
MSKARAVSPRPDRISIDPIDRSRSSRRDQVDAQIVKLHPVARLLRSSFFNSTSPSLSRSRNRAQKKHNAMCWYKEKARTFKRLTNGGKYIGPGSSLATIIPIESGD